MAGFDPSVISGIADNAPNPVKAQQDAFTLYDTKNRVQLNALTLQQAKEEQAEKQAGKRILSQHDLSTDRGQNEALEQVSKVSPELSMKYKKDFAQQKGLDLDNEAKKLQVAQERNAPIVATIDSVLTELAPMKALFDQKKITQGDLDGLTISKALPAIQRMVQDNPDLAPVAAKLLQNPKEALKYSNIESLERTSKLGRDMIGQRLSEANQALSQQKLDQGQERLEQGNQRLEGYLANIGSEVSKRNKDEDAKQNSRLDHDDAIDIARQYLAGDKSVLTGLGRSAENQAAVRKAIREESANQGVTPEQRAARIAEYNGYLAEERRLGTSQANIESAATEAGKVLPIALDASNAVPRTKWVPVNKIIQAGKVATSDKDLAKFAQANLTLANVYSRAMNPNGTATVSGRDHALEVLSTAPDQGAYNGVLQILSQEIDAARSAPPEIRKKIFDQIATGKATHQSIMEDLFPDEAKTVGGQPKRPGQQTSGAPKALTPSKTAPKAKTNEELIAHYGAE